MPSFGFAFVLTGSRGASVFTRKAWLGHFIPSRSGAFAIAHWTLLYAISPLLEKRWLERVFGADYLEYKTKTLRFLVF